MNEMKLLLVLLVCVISGHAITKQELLKKTEDAVDVLMTWYNNRTGLFDGVGWWNSANCMTSMTTYWLQSGGATNREILLIKWLLGSQKHRWIMNHTFAINNGRFVTGWYPDSLDDAAWWGLAWIKAFDVTGERRYLDAAVPIADNILKYVDDVCGGGSWRSTNKKFKNAITNSLLIKLLISLHNRLDSQKSKYYLDHATAIFDW